MRTVTFSVSYTLREYLSFAREHGAALLAERRRREGKPVPYGQEFRLPFHVRWAINLSSSIAFYLKHRQMPVCDFAIDERSIRRVAANGRLIVPWAEVVAIHRYSRGYLVARSNGAMPLPFRCLNPEQATLLEELVVKRERELANGRKEAPAPQLQ
ncbi:MAG TPA: YcxB family protein [Paucimonas sp.]|nr:YcxB family protein [Paucimonas sp.]